MVGSDDRKVSKEKTRHEIKDKTMVLAFTEFVDSLMIQDKTVICNTS